MNIKMLKDIDFAGIIANTVAVTEAGREFIKNYAGYLFSHEANYGLVNGFVAEARNYSYDKGVMEGLAKVAQFISEHNISWQLASVCESVSAKCPAYDYISKNAVSQVDKLLESLDENQVVQYIKAGALKNICYIPEFKKICKSVYADSVLEVQAPNYTLTAPVTFTESQGENVFFQVGNHIYKSNGNTVVECSAPSKLFTRVNASIEGMVKLEEGLQYTWKVRDMKFLVNEAGIEVTLKNGEKTLYENEDSFNQFRDVAQRGLFNTAMKNEFMAVTEAIMEVHDNYDDICECDLARVLQTSNGTVAVIVESKENVIVNTLASRQGSSFKSYDTIIEALKAVEKISGVNLQVAYENRINEEAKNASDAEIKEAMEELQERQKVERQRRIEQLTEKFKDNPLKLSILNKLAKEISRV